MSNTGIRVGHDEAAIKAIGVNILDILKCGQEQETIRKALEILARVTQINNIAIKNCSITINEDKKEKTEEYE